MLRGAQLQWASSFPFLTRMRAPSVLTVLLRSVPRPFRRRPPAPFFACVDCDGALRLRATGAAVCLWGC